LLYSFETVPKVLQGDGHLQGASATLAVSNHMARVSGVRQPYVALNESAERVSPDAGICIARGRRGGGRFRAGRPLG
jgi:hypothetical protein